MEIDKDGGSYGAAIFTYASCSNSSNVSNSSTARYLHEIIWERNAAKIPPRFKIVHKNGITMDNRFDNLQIIPQNGGHKEKYQNCGRRKRRKVLTGDSDTCDDSEKLMERSLYWTAIRQLPSESSVIDEVSHYSNVSIVTSSSLSIALS